MNKTNKNECIGIEIHYSFPIALLLIY